MSLSAMTHIGTSAGPTSVRSRRRIVLAVTYALGIIAVALFIVHGYSYYTTPYLERPHHPDYRDLRPAGTVGLTYGIVGSAMMVLMLVYSLRKRTGFFSRRIPLRPFLDFHIIMGVFGPLLILLHTSFKVQGLVAVAFWSMVAVALSGYFGRYLYQQIPRNLEDKELDLGEIDLLIDRLSEEMRAEGQLDEAAVKDIAASVEAAYAVHGRGTLSALVSVMWRDLIRFWTDARLRRELAHRIGLSGDSFNRLFAAARLRALLRRRLALLGRIQRLFHYWHVIHKPFAIIMYIIMVVHIAVAIWTGYGWF